MLADGGGPTAANIPIPTAVTATQAMPTWLTQPHRRRQGEVAVDRAICRIAWPTGTSRGNGHSREIYALPRAQARTRAKEFLISGRENRHASGEGR